MIKIKELIRELEIGTVIRDKETPWNYDYCWLDFCDGDGSSVSVYDHNHSTDKLDGSESKIHWDATLPRDLVDKALQELIKKGQSLLTAEVEVGESFYQKVNHDGIDKREQRYMADITIDMKLIEEQPQLKVSKHRCKQYF